MEDRILVFIPCYNCEKQVVRVLEQLDRRALSFIDRVLIVNNRSTDNTEQAAAEYLARHKEIPAVILRNEQNYNLGGSHKVAFEYAMQKGFDYVLVLHGDDQASFRDIIPVLRSKKYREYDCTFGARFKKGGNPFKKDPDLIGYSALRIWGNYVFNDLFSVICKKRVYDLGSGLNIYKVDALKSKYYIKFPDTLYFNDTMLIYQCYFNKKILFFPITWREEDQVSNNKLINFSISLLKMLFKFKINPKAFLNSDMREVKHECYPFEIFYSNLNTDSNLNTEKEIL